MQNYLAVFIATLEHLKLITEADAKKLVNEFENSTIPAGYKSASSMVKDIFEKHDIKVVTPVIKKVVDTKK